MASFDEDTQNKSLHDLERIVNIVFGRQFVLQSVADSAEMEQIKSLALAEEAFALAAQQKYFVLDSNANYSQKIVEQILRATTSLIVTRDESDPKTDNLFIKLPLEFFFLHFAPQLYAWMIINARENSQNVLGRKIALMEIFVNIIWKLLEQASQQDSALPIVVKARRFRERKEVLNVLCNFISSLQTRRILCFEDFLHFFDRNEFTKAFAADDTLKKTARILDKDNFLQNYQGHVEDLRA